MIKQIDRVKSDLVNQVRNLRRRSGSSKPISVAIVGINYAEVTTSYEGDRSYRTDGGLYKHPIQEAEQARVRLARVAPEYDEFLILKYRATNESPYPFEWVNQRETMLWNTEPPSSASATNIRGASGSDAIHIRSRRVFLPSPARK